MSDILWATLDIGVRVGLVIVVLCGIAVLAAMFYSMFTEDHYYDYLDREVYDYEKDGM
jgi:hypothetical protein